MLQSLVISAYYFHYYSPYLRNNMKSIEDSIFKQTFAIFSQILTKMHELKLNESSSIVVSYSSYALESLQFMSSKRTYTCDVRVSLCMVSCVCIKWKEMKAVWAFSQHAVQFRKC